MSTIGPKPWTDLNYAGVGVHRNLDCPLYRGCLDIAEKEGWNSFTCVFCPMSKGEWSPSYDENTFICNEDEPCSVPERKQNYES